MKSFIFSCLIQCILCYQQKYYDDTASNNFIDDSRANDGSWNSDRSRPSQEMASNVDKNGDPPGPYERPSKYAGGNPPPSARRPDSYDAWIENSGPTHNFDGPTGRRYEPTGNEIRPMKSSLRRFRRKIVGSHERTKDNLESARSAAYESVNAAESASNGTGERAGFGHSKNRSMPDRTGDRAPEESTDVGGDEGGDASETTEPEPGTETDEKYSFPWTWLEFFNPRKFVQAWSDIPRQYFSLLFGKYNPNDLSKTDRKKWATMMKYFLE